MTDMKPALIANASKRVTAVELARDALRNAILRGDLPGGTRLIQTDIANELRISTTPVREAMRELASDGLITLDSHRVGIVRKPDWHEMQDIIEMRHALESMAVSRAMAHITPKELEQARMLAEAMADEDADLGTWVQTNINFHSVFHQATRAVRLIPVLISLDNAAGVFAAQAQLSHPEVRQKGVQGHFELIEAYESKDLERAIAIEHDHSKLPLEVAPASEISADAEA